MIVNKAVNMANMMNGPVLGLVENMSYYECPDCGKRHAIFGDSHIDKIALEHDIPVVAKLPIDSNIAHSVDIGRVETIDAPWLKELADKIEA